MNELSARLRASLWWLLPLALLALAIGWEIDWATPCDCARRAPEPIAPKPVTAGLLPDYVIEAASRRTRRREPDAVHPTRRRPDGGRRSRNRRWRKASSR